MTRRVRTFAVAVCVGTLAIAVAGCSGESVVSALPTATTPIPTAPPPQSAIPTGSFNLSGIVSEATPAGSKPLAAVDLEIAVCPPLNQAAASHIKTVTDANGFYSVSNMCPGTTYVWLAKAGYKASPPRQCDGDCLHATINGDTRFDIELVRQ